jgi:hypothetical protein
MFFLAMRCVVVSLIWLCCLSCHVLGTFRRSSRITDEVTKDRKMELERLKENFDHALGENRQGGSSHLK